MRESLNAKQPISTFLEAAAAKQPTPGGGSVAALAGALAAPMGSMVINYSVEKKELALFREELLAALHTCEKARGLLLELMVEDQEAFTLLTATRKTRESDDAAFVAALASAIRIPQAVGATAVAMLSLIDKLVEKVNPFLLSDLAVCGDLAMATIRCAIYNVHANLPDVAGTDERVRLMTDTDRMMQHGLALIQSIAPRIVTRMEKKN